MEAVVAVFIPIILFLVIGLVIVIAIYYKSREKQLLIEKGLSAEEIKKFFEDKRDPFIMLKIGIISVFFGLGIGFGMMLERSNHGDYWVPLFLFTFTGVGFVIANLVGNKLKEKYLKNTEE
jgi:ABC-type spermidine/putrescine transport system permease subunit II